MNQPPQSQALAEPQLVRLTVNITEEEYAGLERVAAALGLSVTDALRRALVTQAVLTDAEAAGGKIFVESKDKKRRQILLR